MSKNKIGDKVIYIGDKIQYMWKLEHGETYVISGFALDVKGGLMYSLTHKDGSKSSWYSKDDFISLSEYRKVKLEKINI